MFDITFIYLKFKPSMDAVSRSFLTLLVRSVTWGNEAHCTESAHKGS